MRRRIPFRFGPAPEPPPKPKPYTILKKPRPVPPALRLPSDLTAWYTKHEGMGLGAIGQWPLRLAKLEELRWLKAADLGIFRDEALAEWAGFEAIRIATGVPAEAIVYILASHCFRFGTIVAFGASLMGPPTSPTGQPPGSLSLDLNFGGWATRLDYHGWVEPGLSPASIDQMRKGESESLRRHFRRLNPGLPW
jgi:hypothetical protein